MKRNNIWIIGIPEGEEKEQGIENLFEKVITETFPNLVRGEILQILEAEREGASPDEPKEAHSKTYYN